MVNNSNKHMKIRFIFLLVFLMINSISHAQSHYLLSRLEAFRADNRVIINWTIRRGGSCFGIGILRSVDKINYTVIGEISGDCGSSESEQSYTFTDENPVKDKVNFYVLEMGFSGKTEPPLSVEYFDFAKNESKVIPNPIYTAGKIHFINPDYTPHTLTVFDESGKLIKTVYTNTEYFGLTSDILDTKSTFGSNKFYYTIAEENGKRVSSGFFLGFFH